MAISSRDCSRAGDLGNLAAFPIHDFIESGDAFLAGRSSMAHLAALEQREAVLTFVIHRYSPLPPLLELELVLVPPLLLLLPDGDTRRPTTSLCNGLGS